jgi:hypothetical protein
MKKTFFGFIAIAMLALQPAAVFAAPSTEVVQSRANGLHIGGAATDRVSFYDGTPAVQSAATKTAWQALQDHGFIATGSDYSVQHVTVALTAAQIIAMYTTPVVLVAAPGSGKSILVTKLAFTIIRTSTAFTGGAAAIVQYDSTANGAGTQALDSTIASTVITGSAGTTVTARNGAVISDLASTSIQNKGLYISNGTAVFAAGTGTATVDVWYVVY